MKSLPKLNSLIALVGTPPSMATQSYTQEAFDTLLDIIKLLNSRVTKLEIAVKTLKLQQRPFRKMGK